MKVTNGKMPSSFLKETGDHKLSNVRGLLVIILIILAIWQGLSLVYPPLVLPGPALICQALVKIIKGHLLFVAILSTLRKLVIGLLVAISMGSAFGILLGCNQKIKNLLEPLLYLIQATPPILYMTMAMIWFGLNGSAIIFIVFIGSAPVMAVTILKGFENIDIKLIEMGKAFNFSKLKTIRSIILPSLKTYFKTGLITVFSFGWKLVVMGEVLSSSTGLGAQITDARMNLETNMVFAWGIIVILLCFLFQAITSRVFELKPKRRVYER